MKRIVLFLVTNLAVMLVLGVVAAVGDRAAFAVHDRESADKGLAARSVGGLLVGVLGPSPTLIGIVGSLLAQWIV